MTLLETIKRKKAQRPGNSKIEFSRKWFPTSAFLQQPISNQQAYERVMRQRLELIFCPSSKIDWNANKIAWTDLSFHRDKLVLFQQKPFLVIVSKNDSLNSKEAIEQKWRLFEKWLKIVQLQWLDLTSLHTMGILTYVWFMVVNDCLTLSDVIHGKKVNVKK